MRGSRVIVKAALSIVLGWYFLVPPGLPEHPHLADTTVPLSRWSIFRSYDTAGECQRFLSFVQQKGSEAWAKAGTHADRSFVVNSMICVSTDDPRLR